MAEEDVLREVGRGVRGPKAAVLDRVRKSLEIDRTLRGCCRADGVVAAESTEMLITDHEGIHAHHPLMADVG